MYLPETSGGHPIRWGALRKVSRILSRPALHSTLSFTTFLKCSVPGTSWVQRWPIKERIWEQTFSFHLHDFGGERGGQITPLQGLLINASCLGENKLMFQTQCHIILAKTVLLESTGLQVFLCDEWDKRIDESRPLATYPGSPTMNHNHSTFTINPQFICRRSAALDGQIAQGYWMKDLLFMTDDICPSVFIYLIEKCLAYSNGRKFSFPDTLLNTPANEIGLTKNGMM